MSIRKKLKPKMPREGLEMSSPQIGHLAARFGDAETPKAKEPHYRARNVVAPDPPSGSTIRRSGQNLRPRRPTKRLEVSSPQIGHLAGRFVDPEKPTAKDAQKRARNVVAPDRPSESAIRRSGKTYGQRAPLKGSKCRRPDRPSGSKIRRSGKT